MLNFMMRVSQGAVSFKVHVGQSSMANKSRFWNM